MDLEGPESVVEIARTANKKAITHQTNQTNTHRVSLRCNSLLVITYINKTSKVVIYNFIIEKYKQNFFHIPFLSCVIFRIIFNS